MTTPATPAATAPTTTEVTIATTGYPRMRSREAYADPAAPIEIARPTVQYTCGAPHANVQFQQRSKRTGEWRPERESYHPTQADWAARAPAGSPDGYWSDAEVEADLLAYLAAELGITHAVIVDPSPS